MLSLDRSIVEHLDEFEYRVSTETRVADFAREVRTLGRTIRWNFRFGLYDHEKHETHETHKKRDQNLSCRLCISWFQNFIEQSVRIAAWGNVQNSRGCQGGSR